MREFAVSVLVRLQDRLSQPLGGLQRRLQGLGRLGERLGLGRVGSQLANVGKQFTLLAGAAALAFTAIGGGAWGMARSVANAGDAAYKAAQRVGVNVETYQELAFAAKMSDLSVESLQKALGTLNEKAIAGDEMFSKLGIALKDSHGNLRDSGDLLKDLATLFSQLPNGAQKGALAAKIFGDRLGRELIPFLNEGRDGLDAIGQKARDLGIVLPEELAKAAVDWNDSITVFGAVFDGLKMEIFGPLIPVFNELTNSFREFIQANRADIVEAMSSAINGVANAIPAIVDGLRTTGNVLGPVVSGISSFIDAIGGMETVAIVVAGVISSKLIFAIGALGVALLMTPIGWFIIAVTTIALLAKTIYENWDGIAEWFGEMWGKVTEYGEVAFDFLKALFAWTPLGMLVASFGPVLDWFKGWWQEIEDPAASAFDFLKALFAWTPLGMLVASFGPALDWFKGWWQEIEDPAASAFDFLKALFAWTPLGMLVASFGPALDWFKGWWQEIEDPAASAFDFLKALFAWTPLGMLVASFGPALDWFKSWWPQVETLAADAFDTLKTLFAWHPLALIVANWGPILDFMSTIWEGMRAGFSEAWNGIESGFFDLINDLADWMPKAVEAFYAGPGPLLEAGAKIIQALWDGIKAKFAELIEWLRGVPGMIADAIGNIDPVGAIKDRVSAGISSIGEGVSSSASAVGEAVNAAASTVGGWAQRAWNWSTGDTPQLAAPAAAMAAGRSSNDNSAAPLRSQPQEVDVGGVIKVEVTGPGKVTSAENSNRGVRMAPNRGQSLVNE
jgi:hypothetical protein